jgi:hypothetical protein
MGLIKSHKVSLDDCSQLCISRLYGAVKKSVMKDYDPKPEEFVETIQQALSEFVVNNQTFEYDIFHNKVGRQRWYFKCPKCLQRTTKLFLPPEGKGFEPKYLCKRCHSLKPRSTTMGPTHMYKYVYRPLKKLYTIERKLQKSRWLPSEKIELLLAEYKRIEEEMKKSPYYKLYEFKKKRGLID